MCFKYKYKNERLLNIIKWRKHFLLRNCLKPNRENKNHKSNLHPQPPKGKHLKFLQLEKKKERKNRKLFPQKERNKSQMLGNSERRCPQCTSQKIQWRTLLKTDKSEVNNVGNTEEQYTKLALRCPVARHLWLMQLLLRECGTDLESGCILQLSQNWEAT